MYLSNPDELHIRDIYTHTHARTHAPSLADNNRKHRAPQVACWLLDPDWEEQTLADMVTAYCPEELPLLEGLGEGRHAHTHCPRVKAATESVLVHAAMGHLTGLLEKDGMLGT